MVGTAGIDAPVVVEGERYTFAFIRNTHACTRVGFPWKDLPKGTTVCDVGGGVGAILLRLAKAYPHLRFTLHDAEPVLQHAQQVRSSPPSHVQA